MPRYNYECDHCGWDYDYFGDAGTQPEYMKCAACKKRAYRSFQTQIQSNRSQWPIHSEALALLPEQVAEQQAKCKRFGVSTDFDEKARPIFRDRGHRKAYMKMEQVYDKDGGYGDG